MNREVSKLLTDIDKSISLIEGHLQNVATLSDFENNITVSDAVERRLAIIGEAMWKADKIDKDLIVSEKKKIISLRHIIIHDYDLVDSASIWVICKKTSSGFKRRSSYNFKLKIKHD